MESKSMKFEAAIRRLDEIVKQLERGDVALEDALKLFQEGTALVGSCKEQLNHAELEIVKLTKGPDGAPIESEFTHEVK